MFKYFFVNEIKNNTKMEVVFYVFVFERNTNKILFKYIKCRWNVKRLFRTQSIKIKTNRREEQNNKFVLKSICKLFN